MVEIQQRAICDGVNFRSIKDTRFKTLRIAVNFMVPLNETTVAANALLPFLLSRACKEYPDYTKMEQHFSELYGAQINVDVQKLGEVQVLGISAIGIADCYTLHGETISDELAKLLCSMIFQPLLENGVFPKEGFDQEKRQTLEMIQSEYNDKRIYAKLRCEQIMCANEKFGLNRYGNKELVENIKLSEMNQVWQNLLDYARIEIMALGNCDPLPVYEAFCQAFKKYNQRKPADCKTQIITTVENVNHITEKMDIAQSKMVLGFRAGMAIPDENVNAMKLMTALFGGTPHSKLFLNVREKLSLCYYCSSRYDPNKGIILVESGVETKNIKKAHNEIMHQLNEIVQGNFTEDELNSAKMSICNSYRTIGDYLGGLESWYIAQTFYKTVKTPEQAAESINAVTRDQIISAAKKVCLDTVYCLIGNEEELE